MPDKLGNWGDYMNPSRKDSIDAIYKKKEPIVQEDKKDTSSMHYSKLPEEKLEEIQKSIYNLQYDFLNKKNKYPKIEKKLEIDKKRAIENSKTYDDLQDSWNKIESDYVKNAQGVDKIPAFLRSIVNFYPKDHVLHHSYRKSDETPNISNLMDQALSKIKAAKGMRMENFDKLYTSKSSRHDYDKISNLDSEKSKFTEKEQLLKSQYRKGSQGQEPKDIEKLISQGS